MSDSKSLVLHIISGLGDGGAQAALFRLCTTDTFYKHKVVCLSEVDKYYSLMQSAGISVVSLDMPSGRVTLNGIWVLWKLLRSERPDVVQTWMYHSDLLGGMLAHLAGCNNILWNIRHSNLTVKESSPSSIVVAHLCAWLSKKIPKRIICCAEKASITHIAMGYDAAKMVVIPNGYDLSVYKPDLISRQRLRTEWGLGENVVLIGMVARFNPQKDHANLIAALSLLQSNELDFRCCLIGKGLTSDNHIIRSWLKTKGLENISLLLGQQTDIPAVMNALDIHVLSSSFGEGFPNVIAEAMSCGTPCITTDVGDAASIVDNCGWIVPPNDPNALSKALSNALEEKSKPEDWSARQTAARQRILENFSIHKMLDSYHSIWQMS